MIKAIVFDFSRVLLDVKDKNYQGSLNGRHDQLKQTDSYKLYDHFELNEELLDLAAQLKTKYPLYIFTTGHIHTEPEIQDRISGTFQRMFSLEDIGGRKDNPNSFKEISRLIETAPEDILFIDDTEENIEAAKLAGLQTVQFINNAQLFKNLQEFLN